MSRLSELNEQVEKAFHSLNIESMIVELEEISKVSGSPNFWNDNLNAADTMQRANVLKEAIEPWQRLKKEVEDLLSLEKMDDKSLEKDIENQYKELQQRYDQLKKDLKFNGKYDRNNAILSIHAGAGGTDAQDWTAMLLRMYLRWAERNSLKTQVLEESNGEEAGLKSVSVLIEGKNAFGQLKGEHGVHRLVRLSPFNANNLRQTSFAKVEVTPKIDTDSDVALDEKDLKIDVFRAGGRGGQSVNTTDSAVRVTHMPTNIVVSIQNERSQLQNKETALSILKSKLIKLKEEQNADKLSELKGVDVSAEWGNQIRNYVLHPYTMVKDQRSKYETTDAQAVLDGRLEELIDAYLDISG